MDHFNRLTNPLRAPTVASMPLSLPDFDQGPCPAREKCASEDTCPEPVRCLIDRAAEAAKANHILIVNTDNYTFEAV